MIKGDTGGDTVYPPFVFTDAQLLISFFAGGED